MNKLVTIFFSTKKLGTDAEIDQILKELGKAFLGTEISETLKAHVLVEHIKHCLQFVNDDEEQAGESVHCAFNKYWERYQVYSIKRSSYSKRLKKAVLEFSSSHI